MKKIAVVFEPINYETGKFVQVVDENGVGQHLDSIGPLEYGEDGLWRWWINVEEVK